MKTRHYNSYFTMYYEPGDARTINVNATNLQYSLQLTNSGKSYSRQRQTVYPKRFEQSAITGNFVFRDVDELLEFADFVRAAHLRVTSGNQMPRLAYIAKDVSHNSWHPNGFAYFVAIEELPVSVSYNTVAPEIKGLRMLILGDDSDGTNADSSEMVGDEYDLVSTPEGVGDLAQSGDLAFR